MNIRVLQVAEVVVMVHRVAAQVLVVVMVLEHHGMLGS